MMPWYFDITVTMSISVSDTVIFAKVQTLRQMQKTLLTSNKKKVNRVRKFKSNDNSSNSFWS